MNRDTTGHLAATHADRAKLAEASRVVVLVGSFDGSGNFGDILQTRAVIERIRRGSPSMLIAVVVEASYTERYPWVQQFLNDVVTLRFSSRRPSVDLLESLPEQVLLYLSGGGFVNQAWGDRKLAQIVAVTTVVNASGGVLSHRIATGQQVSSYDGLPRWVEWFETCDLLTVRDPDSARTLRAAGLTTVAEDRGDDAYGPVRALDIELEEGCVNVHINVESYTTPERDERLAWLASALAELQIDGDLRCRFLVAFDDDRISERAAVDEVINRLRADHSRLDMSHQVISLPAVTASGNTLTLGARGTIACSYHVGLASLMCGVPTLLLADNPYYQQKMGGLARAFGIEEEQIISSSTHLDIVDALAQVGARLRSVHPLALRAIDGQIAGVDNGVARVLADFESVADRALLADVLASYRSAVAERADLCRQVDQLGRWLEQAQAGG